MKTLCKDVCKVCVTSYFKKELSNKELSFFFKDGSFDEDWETHSLVFCPYATEESLLAISINSKTPTTCRYSMEQLLFRQSL